MSGHLVWENIVLRLDNIDAEQGAAALDERVESAVAFAV
jgi:hypothetical protein